MTGTISPVLGEATVQELREAVRGTVFTDGDEGYAEAAQIWNGAHDGHRPALVVQCTGVADVVAAVGFARSNHLPLAVRGGGHSIAGFSTCDGGLVVDLSPMRSVRVDKGAMTVSVGGGATWADVDHETQAQGLATTGGLVSSTGVGGFTLGGGIGWLMRKHGLACDNLVGADLVTADGRVLHVSETENADVLWGLRGGGGNFGVVTRFELRVHPVGPMVTAGVIFYPAAAAGDLLRTFGEWAADAPDEITTLVNLTTAPPLPVIPEEWHGRKVAVLAGLSTDAADALIEPVRSVAEPVADLFGPMPYQAMQGLLDPLWPKGIHAYFKATNLSRLDDALIDRLVALHLAAPGPQCEIHVHQMGGALGRVAEDATAFGDRSAPYVLNAVTGWHAEEDAESHTEWARATIAAAGTSSTGHAYVNFLGDAGAGATSYARPTYERLLELKRKLDPDNVFRLNQNIDPRPTS
ncbi:MAG TPA: FAD-binding oxidoreductase [Gaiellaceae bacterium]